MTDDAEVVRIGNLLENVAADLAARGMLMHADAVERARDALYIAITELERTADHFDMDGYGGDAWKTMALEMGQSARDALVGMGVR